MISEFIQELALGAGKITLDFFDKAEVQYTKAHALDVVTQADLRANAFIVDAIRSKFPHDGIISEETGESKTDAEFVWIIDPLDGTLNFSKGIPLYAVMIARTAKGVVEHAVIYDPVHDDMYFAEKGKGAFHNGKPMTCSQADSIEASVIFTTSSSNKSRALLAKIVPNDGKGKLYLTAYMCMGLGLAHVACGKRDAAVIQGSGQMWDYAPGALLMEEAGCKVTTVDGKPRGLMDLEIVAANPALHEKIMRRLQS
jgi:myo-inositol-1(or 4)-monophosphatase